MSWRTASRGREHLADLIRSEQIRLVIRDDQVVNNLDLRSLLVSVEGVDAVALPQVRRGRELLVDLEPKVNKYTYRLVTTKNL